MQRSVIVENTDIQNIIKTISILQEDADRVTEESTPAEIKDAFHKHGIAQGYIRCLRDSKLIQASNYGRLLMRNIRIGEKISKLQEKRTSGTANTGKPNNKKFVSLIIRHNQEEINMVKGIVRKFDELGRITIPKEMRRSLKLKEKDPVDIYLNNGAICMEPVREASCAICNNSTTGMIKVNDRHICLDCLNLIREEGKKVGR